MKITVDFRSSEPIYVQIMEQIRHKVATGEMRPGDQLPTVRQLATDLRVNFNTVARAYRMLDEAGLISTQKGRGTYIWEADSVETQERLRRESLDYLARHFLADAAQRGYDEAAVRETVQKLLDDWQQTGKAPAA